ncbi:hypothetical protein D3C72_1368140 [compost metagenome]
MVGRHIDHGAGDGQRGERVVGRRLDDRVAAQHHVADDGKQRQAGRVAGDDMQGARAKAADFQFGAIDQLLRHPAFQVLDADRAFHGFGDCLARQHVAQAHVGALDHGRGHRRGVVGEGAGFLQVRVGAQVKAFAEGFGVVEDIVEAELVRVGKAGRIAQRQLVEILVGVRGQEGQVAAAAADFDEVVGDDLAADDHRRDGKGLGLGHVRDLALGTGYCSTVFRKSMASRCEPSVAAQVILSSPPFFSL